MNILLIEPDSVLAKAYKTTLDDVGHDVQCFNSAIKAISSADKKRPDLIILEIKLPARSGIEFLYEFRSYHDWQEIPILILSSVRKNEVMVSESVWQNLNIKNYLHKPSTSLNMLANAVNNIFIAA